MISPAVLEQPGAWRAVGLGSILILTVAPALPLLVRGLDGTWSAFAASGFTAAMARSAIVATGASLAALVLGFPSGLVAGLYRFPARRLLLAVLAVPLLMPSFLWAIGLSMLRIDLGLSPRSGWSQAFGVVWSFAALGAPLVAFAVLVAVRLLPASAIDAARLTGGERAVLHAAARAALPAAVGAALLAGIVTLSDPGPGQILGFSGIGAEILISFSALYDFDLAAQQALITAALVLLAAAPLIWLVARRLSFALLPREARQLEPRPAAAARWAGPVVLGAIVLVTLVAPVAGLARPVANGLWLDEVWIAVARTGGNTLFYGLLAGVVATAAAVPLALCATRVVSLRALALAGLVVVLVLPPAAGALGTVLLASEAPAWLDPIVRSRFTVAAVLGLRLTAIAAVVLVRALGAAPRSWAYAGAAHGVPLALYATRVLAPFLARPILLSVALVALVATADVTTVLLLQPPGRDSLPVALFTVMANAPESQVASLCLAYLVLGCTVIAGLMWVARGRDERRRAMVVRQLERRA